MNYEIQELFLYQHAVYKQIVCSSQLIKVKTETKIQIKKQRRRRPGRTEKKTRVITKNSQGENHR